MTREDIIKWAQEAQLPYYFPAVAKQQQTGELAYSNELMRFAELVAEAEREECARVFNVVMYGHAPEIQKLL